MDIDAVKNSIFMLPAKKFIYWYRAHELRKYYKWMLKQKYGRTNEMCKKG